MNLDYKSWHLHLRISILFVSVTLLATIAGCGTFNKESADAQSGSERSQGPTPVDVAIARTGQLRSAIEYTGTTAPVQEVSLRSQVEGQVLAVYVDIGDAVKESQLVGQLDDDLLQTALNEARAELAALKAEVARAQNQVSNARAEVAQARLEQQQAQSDSQRQQKLVQAGAVAEQVAEQARTTARTSVQAVRAALEQVRTEQQAVAAAQRRVTAQQAVVAQAQEQLSYARLISPITGKVTQRLTEPGNFVQTNGEIIRIGDFSRVEVVVEVSELEIAKIRVGQAVTVSIDAFSNQTFQGQVTRVSPAVDRVARLVPVEVVVPNSNGRVGSGLLARVSFERRDQERVVVPESAIAEAAENLSKGAEAQGAREQRSGGAEGQGAEEQESSGTLFVVDGGEGSQATVAAREVKLGERSDGNVEILSGLRPGERFVAKSDKPLKDGETVRLSILSEKKQPGS